MENPGTACLLAHIRAFRGALMRPFRPMQYSIKFHWAFMAQGMSRIQLSLHVNVDPAEWPAAVNHILLSPSERLKSKRSRIPSSDDSRANLVHPFNLKRYTMPDKLRKIRLGRRNRLSPAKLKPNKKGKEMCEPKFCKYSMQETGW